MKQGMREGGNYQQGRREGGKEGMSEDPPSLALPRFAREGT
jgi:hypothetical protein